jgi:hypothetical protein
MSAKIFRSLVSRLVRHVRKDHGDVQAAAKALGARPSRPTPSSCGGPAERCSEAALTEAQHNGLMSHFYATYRTRREAAQAVGKGFMSYGRATARLRAAVAGIIARGGDLDLAIIRRVLD